MAGLLILFAVLAIAAGAFTVFHNIGFDGHKPAITSDKLPPAIRNGAAIWVSTQLAAGDTVGCDPVMCRVLQTHGMSLAHLHSLWPRSGDLSGCAVVVATPVLAAQFGNRLDSLYAPVVIARFGSGSQQIAVRVIAPDGVAAYRTALANDLALRRQAAATLTGGASAQLSAAEKEELAAGHVDERLMVLLAALESTKHPVQVAAFGGAGPGVSAAVSPLRSADLVVTSSASQRSILAAIQATGQDARFRPAHIGTIRLRTGRTLLQIEFAAPTLLGLLGPQ